MNDSSPYALELAEINWIDECTPQSRQYGDIYFSRQQGLHETRFVFLEQNQLEQKWQQLDSNNAATFTIAETGFGTGLNFLAAAKLWSETAPKNHQLHFISVEKHPLKRQDLDKALSAWPELEEFSCQLLDQYPALIPGQHILYFNHESIVLHLLLGEASDSLQQLLDSDHPGYTFFHGAKVDAWFLDGFAPVKNSALWNEKILSIIADLSHSGTSFSTFTAAGQVRRDLLAQGFHVEKVTGYGKKREMIRGHYIGKDRLTLSAAQRKSTTAPWALPPTAVSNQLKSATVIGGGLAGVNSAYALARRGWQVSLIERHPHLAQEASGNGQGMLYTRLSPDAGTLNQFTLFSYLYALNFYRRLALPQQVVDYCGLLQLGDTGTAFSRLQQAFKSLPELVQFLTADQASEIAGVSIPGPAYYFPDAGWMSPPALCRQLASHPNIQLITHSEAITISYRDQQWQAQSVEGKTLAESAVTIIANSADAIHFEQTAHLPLKSIRGQTTTIDSNKNLGNLRTIICHEGYLTPALNQQHTLGATFDNLDLDPNPKTQDHWQNLSSLYNAVPACFPDGIDQLDEDRFTGRVGFRCTTPDYLPIAGAVHRHQQFLEDYAPLRKNAHNDINIPGAYYPGLYMNVAHGSRGLTSSPLCSELLAALICGEPRPMPRKLWQALSPARFLIRDMIRNKI